MNDTLTSSPELQAKLKNCDTQVQQYVLALETEVANVAKRDAKHQVEKISFNAKIKALEHELTHRVDYGTLTEEQLQLLIDHGYKPEGKDSDQLEP